jgi:hypothetical protein
LSCNEVGGSYNPFTTDQCCYGLNDDGSEPNFFYGEEYLSNGEGFEPTT